MAEKNRDKDEAPPAEGQEPKPEVKEPEPEVRVVPEPPPLPYTPQVMPLTDREILEVRWIVWGKCPSCGESVRGWNPGPFHAGRYTMWQSQGIHVLSGHREECPDKFWRRQS